MESRFFPAILTGTGVSIGIALCASAMMATLLKFTSLTEHSVGWVMVAAALLALFIGGFIAGGKSGTKGWLAGALCALIFSAIVLAISYLGYNETISVKQLLLFASYGGIAALGGMIGVNLSNAA
ncbi:putative membrane protein (TIGR04086 family) [Alkalihalobacillus xiaoxiensis]|uniref:Membrane protein (TIGR04086 family) n=1 Tax=Shouchella xiaoxiensis TaxID=766895 RepID=A0ABS2SR49_9BACI|nr:TIGR04086 family membrane protein [Shouchella xiaoxiensis]MBM7837994.1 putative membrane protein (TIGR04086 family) [Shouchella xiaoxiensis]